MVRGTLRAVVARRLSAAAYAGWRSSPSQRAPSRRALIDARGPLPQPTVTQQLAVAIADRLPDWAVRALGRTGLRAIATLLAAPVRLLIFLLGGRTPAPEPRR